MRSRCLLMALPISACLAAASAAHAQSASASELLRRAMSEHQRGDLASAARDYEHVLQQHPDLTQARYNLALLRLQSGAAAEAAQELEKASPAERTDPRIAMLLAECYRQINATPKAVPVLQAAWKAHPTEYSLGYQLGLVLTRAGRNEESLDVLERAGKGANLADAWLMAGATSYQLGQFGRARQDLETALRLDPKLPGVYLWTGLARDKNGDEENAKDALRKALAATPDDFEANLHLGAILYRERDFAAATPYIEHALQLKPEAPMARFAMALVRSGTGKNEEAVKLLEAITQTAPDWVEPHVKLASLYFKLRKADEGKREQSIVDQLKSENRGKSATLEAY